MSKSSRSVRIGPLSLFALISILFLSTLAVLSLTTANASLNLSTLQADGMKQQYAAEDAAQRFLALLDNGSSASDDVDSEADAQPASSVDALAKRAAAEAGGTVTASAQSTGSTVTAQFSCPSGRALDIEIELDPNGSFRIIKWNMSAKVNSAESRPLWTGM